MQNCSGLLAGGGESESNKPESPNFEACVGREFFSASNEPRSKQWCATHALPESGASKLHEMLDLRSELERCVMAASFCWLSDSWEKRALEKPEKESACCTMKRMRRSAIAKSSVKKPPRQFLPMFAAIITTGLVLHRHLPIPTTTTFARLPAFGFMFATTASTCLHPHPPIPATTTRVGFTLVLFHVRRHNDIRLLRSLNARAFECSQRRPEWKCSLIRLAA